VPGVLDLVAERKTGLADPRLDATAEHELLAEDRRLEHLALRPQHALVAIPPFAIPGQPGRQATDAAVQAVPDRRADVRLVEVLRRVLVRDQGVVQPAGDDHAPPQARNQPQSSGS
jgi:hypothetical protein